MRKYIIIISALFLFSIAAFAQEIEKKEDVQKNDSAVSVIDDSSAPITQNSDATVTETETKTEKRPPIPPPIERRQKILKPVAEQLKEQPVGPQKSVQDVKINQLEGAYNKSKQVPQLEPALTSTVKMDTPQTAGNKVFDKKAGIDNPVNPEKNSSLNTSSSSSIKNTTTEIPSLPEAVTSRTSVPKGSVSLNFDDTDIYSIIQTVFSEILKVNYIIDPKVKGRITFKSVAPVPKDNVLPLMEVILRLNGVAVVEENSLYRIIPIGDLAREPSAINIGRSAEKVEVKGKALLQVVPIEHLQSSEIIKLITPFTSVNAVIVDVPKSNHIIIVDTDSNVKRLLQLINIFDSEQQKSKGPQVFVHHVQNGKAKDICALLQQIFTRR
jgi:hypothetical protein